MHGVPITNNSSAIQVFRWQELALESPDTDQGRTRAMFGYRVARTSQTCRSIRPSFDTTTAKIVNAIDINHDGINIACISVSITSNLLYDRIYKRHRVRILPRASRIAAPIAGKRERKPRSAAPSHTVVAMLFAQDRQSSD